VVFSLLSHGHALDPLWAIAHGSFLVCQRSLSRNYDLATVFCRVWNLRHGRRFRVTGPVGNLQAAAKHLGHSWLEPDTLKADAWDGHAIPLLEMPGMKFAHELRECARHCMWSRSAKRRKDMRGLDQGVDVEATTQLLRTSLSDQLNLGLLRSILAGAVVTGERAGKAGLACTSFCKFCDCITVESVHHLFWECPAWADVRAKHTLATTAWRADWPSCLSCCAILCNDVIIPAPPAAVPVLGTSAALAFEPDAEPPVLHLDECTID